MVDLSFNSQRSCVNFEHTPGELVILSARVAVLRRNAFGGALSHIHACFERFETHNVVGDGGATTGRRIEASGQLPSEKLYQPPPAKIITTILMAAEAALNAHLEKRHWDWS